MSETNGSDEESSNGVSLNEKLTQCQSENDKLRMENNSLRNDKSLLEEIISEKDKLINNLQLQIDNLQNFSSSIKSPVSRVSSNDLPARSAQRPYRSVSSPVKTNSLKSEEFHLKDETNDIRSASIEDSEVLEERPQLEEPADLTKASNSFSNDETITEDTEEDLNYIPQRNPNHHIPPITADKDSPAKSIASSNYSPQKEIEPISESLNLLATPTASPTASPTRPSVQAAQYMGIPVSDMVWGSSPARKKSPLRGSRVPPMSPLKNQLFAESVSSLASPELNNGDHEDEFVFSPTGSSSNVVKAEDPRSPVASISSIQPSIISLDHVSQKEVDNGNVNDADSVIKYMDKKLNPIDSKMRSRASTVSVLPNASKNTHNLTLSSIANGRNASLNISSLKAPSESNLVGVDAFEFTKGSTAEGNPFSSHIHNKIAPQHNETQSITSTTHSKMVSNPATPATIQSGKFSNFDEDELKNLMVRPNDLETTLVSVVSVIDGSVPSGRKKTDDLSMTFGCFLVEPSGEKREIFKFSKTYSQLLDFDHIVRAHFFELLPLPELSSFLKTTPNTVEFRRQILNNYFYKLYELKIKPKELSLAICRFVSSDPVFKFDFNEHVVKEGLMLRKVSGKLNTTWKVVSCSIYGSTLDVTDIAANKRQILNIPECKLVNEEDNKDIRYGISIIEPRKNVLSSSFNRIILCAESYEDKAEWLEALAKASSGSNQLKSSSESMLSVASGPDLSPDNASIRHNNSKLSSPAISETPATPMSQTSAFEDVAILSSAGKHRKRGGLFGKKREKQGKTVSPEKTYEGSISSTTVIEPVTNLESYQQQQQQQQQQYVLPSATDSTFTFSPYSPSTNFSTGPELFGASLETAVELSSAKYKGKTIPSICFRCIDYLEQKDAIYSEGIFRLTGKSSEINLLNEMFNYKYDVDFDDLEKLPDVDSISTLLKRYLRSLKESVITPDLVAALKLAPNNDNKAAFYKQKVGTMLPKINFDLLYVLLQYLIKVIKNKEINKMDINNITMLFSVNFNVDEDILSELIIDFDFIFDDAAEPLPLDQRPYLRR